MKFEPSQAFPGPRIARRIVVVDFDIVDLRPTDDLLLERCWHLRPRAEVMQMYLNDDVAAYYGVAIFITNKRRSGQIETGRVRRAVDKPEKISRFEAEFQCADRV